MIKTCPKCSTKLTCHSDLNSACWCADFPKIMPMDHTEGCLCPDCLKQEIIKTINHYVATYSTKELVALAKKYDETRTNQIEGIDYTIENGMLVFSKWYHIRRGHCCGNGCVNCAYEHVNVRQK